MKILDGLNRNNGSAVQTVVKLVKGILNQGIDGLGPLSSAEDLAAEYTRDDKFTSADTMVDSLIKWEASKNFGSGFVTSLGGIITLPVSIPASLYASWVVQGRLAGAVASIYGYETSEDRVRTFIMLSMIGNAAKEVLRNSGIEIANALAINAVKSIPSKLLVEINKKVGFSLLARGGEKGAVNIIKAAPVVGGVVGGTIDAAACLVVGRFAKKMFRK